MWSTRDQILGTRLTRGPRRLERHVTGNQDHRGHPADTSVGKSLGEKFTSTSSRRASILDECTYSVNGAS